MISISGLSIRYGNNILLDKVNIQINEKEKIGLVGRNGHGKTTLLRILAGEENADEGNISIPRDYKIGYIKQHIKMRKETVFQEVLSALPSLKDETWKIEKTLFGLGFQKADLTRNPNEFSGGYQIRIQLAKLILSEPDLLLLDEPNNYLDIVALRWLVRFLRRWKRELVLVTHDRGFMDQVVTHVMGIHRHKILKIRGNTEKYYDQLIHEQEIFEKTRLNDEKERKRTELFISRFRAKARLANMVQSRIKALKKKGVLEKREKEKNLEFYFHESDLRNKWLLEMKDLKFGYNTEEILVDGLSFQIKRGEKIAIIGPNGKGKSTLLKLCAGELTPSGGEIEAHPKISIGYYAQTHQEVLHPLNTVEEEIMASYPDAGITGARTICGALMFEGNDAEKKISVLSGGEKSRVLLGKMIMKPTDLLLLDEPTNHLDMQAGDALLQALNDYQGAVLLVTHNENFIRLLADRLIVFDGGNVTLFEGSYDEFLEKQGWSEENLEHISQKRKKSISPKEQRKQRLLEKKLFEKELEPLKKRYIQSEDKLHNIDIAIKEVEERLLKASLESDTEEIQKAGKRIKKLKQDKIIAEKEWETNFCSYEEKKAEFAAD